MYVHLKWMLRKLEIEGVKWLIAMQEKQEM